MDLNEQHACKLNVTLSLVSELDTIYSLDIHKGILKSLKFDI